MPRIKPPRLSTLLQAELDKCPWPVQVVPGKRHWRILIDGTQALVVSYGNSSKHDWRNDENARAMVRRFVRAKQQS